MRRPDSKTGSTIVSAMFVKSAHFHHFLRQSTFELGGISIVHRALRAGRFETHISDLASAFLQQ